MLPPCCILEPLVIISQRGGQHAHCYKALDAKWLATRRGPSHPQQFRCGFLYDRLGIQDARHGGRVGRTLGDHGHWAWALGITWVGTVQDRWASSPILAAARGSLELISTGALISMECLWLAAWEDLCVTLSAVKEWRFLAFFLLSTRR